jgi:hypothetical protein
MKGRLPESYTQADYRGDNATSFIIEQRDKVTIDT